MKRHYRDDFPLNVKQKLAMRVGHRCSKPDCRVPTSGPTDNPRGASNIGKAAHITAAARGGPRYDPGMTPGERRSIANGIWLCSNCADAIDKDTSRFTGKLLTTWKARAEHEAREEQGKPQPSARELAVYKTKAVGENVTGRSITSLVSDTLDVARREIEKLDDRVTVEIDKHGLETRYVFHAKQDFPFQLHVEQPSVEEFKTKFRALRDHGHRLEIDAASVSLTGSRIFELMEGIPGKLIMGTHARRAAVQRLAFTAPGSLQQDVIDVVGEVAGGTQSFTFAGTALDGLYRIAYQCPIDQIGVPITTTIDSRFDLSVWNGRSIHRLQHFERFARFVATLSSGASVHWSLEIEGNLIMEGDSAQFVNPEDCAPFDAMVSYIREARDVARRFAIEVPFHVEKISAVDAQWLHDVWWLLFKMKLQHGLAIGPATVTMQPTDEERAMDLRQSIEKAIPHAITIKQQLARPLSIFGTSVAIGLVTIDYSEATFQVDGLLDAIRAGCSCAIRIVPTTKCVVDVRTDVTDRYDSVLVDSAADS